MTEPDEQDSPLDQPLDPAVEAAVRRTLAGAAGPEPLPGDVAARLDATLDGLVAARGASVSHPENPGIVVPLDAAARRRRVRVRVLLGAAAAVVAIGAAAGVVRDTGSGDSDMTTAAEAGDAPARDDAGAGALSDGADATDGDAKSYAQDQASVPTAASAPLESARQPRRVISDGPVKDVREDHLREDLVALQHASLPDPPAADYTRATLTAPEDFMCEPADFGLGYLVGVTYAGKPAVVAFREPMGSNQEAEILACGTGDVLHSLTLAATG